MSTQRVAKFGAFEFDAASGELRSGGRKLPLQSQPAQVLAHLLNRPGDLVSREELRRAIWAEDTFVDFDTALNVAINKVRQALGDSASAPRFVETVPKRGYRFLADVHWIETPAAVVAETAPPPHLAEPDPPADGGTGWQCHPWLWSSSPCGVESDTIPPPPRRGPLPSSHSGLWSPTPATKPWKSASPKR